MKPLQPLSFAPELKPKEKLNYQQAHGLEDQELVERALRGEMVPAQFLADLNDARLRNGQPFLNPPIGEYAKDKEHLQDLRECAGEDFEYNRLRAYAWLDEIDTEEKKVQLVAMLKQAIPSGVEADRRVDDLARWFGDHIRESGYSMSAGVTTLYKQMILKAFPVVNKDKQFTVDNVEEVLLRLVKLTNDFIDSEGPSKSNANRAFRGSVVY